MSFTNNNLAVVENVNMYHYWFGPLHVILKKKTNVLLIRPRLMIFIPPFEIICVRADFNFEVDFGSTWWDLTLFGN